MTQPNQPKKRKANSSKKSADLENIENPAPVTFQEIAFINRTPPPPKEAENVPNVFPEKVFQQLLAALVNQFQQYLETCGEYYTRAAVMKMFGMKSKNTFNNWMKEKGLPFYQIDSKILIKKSDLEEFLKRYRRVMSLVLLYLSGLTDVGAWLMTA